MKKQCKKKRLPRNFTADELDQGEGMTFHPDNGQRLTLYSYSYGSRVFYIRGGWAGINVSYDRIGDGKSRRAGQLYLKHWVYDPFTGEKL